MGFVVVERRETPSQPGDRPVSATEPPARNLHDVTRIGALPTWDYSRGWGYFPAGGIGLVLAILIILLLMGSI